MFVLLILLAGSRAESWEVVLLITLLGGSLLWIFGREAIHIGASGLVCGLAAFLMLSGFLEKRIIPLFHRALVGFLYGGVLVAGIIPRIGSEVSWDGHLCGAISGAVVAFALARGSRITKAELASLRLLDRASLDQTRGSCGRASARDVEDLLENSPGRVLERHADQPRNRGRHIDVIDRAEPVAPLDPAPAATKRRSSWARSRKTMAPAKTSHWRPPGHPPARRG